MKGNFRCAKVMVISMKQMTTMLLGILAAVSALASCTAVPDPVETAVEDTGTALSQTASSETESDVTVSEPISAESLTLIKHFGQQTEWNDELLLAVSEYSAAALTDESAQKYPALAETLEQTKNGAVRSMEEEYDSLLAVAKEELDLLGADSFVTKESAYDEQIRRADSAAVSILSDSFLVYGNINDRYLNGTTYDTETAKSCSSPM